MSVHTHWGYASPQGGGREDERMEGSSRGPAPRHVESPPFVPDRDVPRASGPGDLFVVSRVLIYLGKRKNVFVMHKYFY